MIYKVKNISEAPYSFEGIELQPGEVSGELTLEVYQRVLALNYGTVLMPVEDSDVVAEPAAPEPVQEEVEVPVEEPVVVPVVNEPAPVVEEVPVIPAEPPVEAPKPKKRGRPRKNP